MAVQSTARYVSYDLRPAKQCERKMMLDSFSAAMESGFSIPDYRYVGMGGNRFYDFILIHKYLGIDKMVSLEHDEKMLTRARYNCPYKFIEIGNTTVDRFIDEDEFDGNTIFWMDYDRPISNAIVGDIVKTAQSLKIGDFVFATVCGTPPKALLRLSAKDRLVELQERFGDAGKTVSMTDVEDRHFSDAVYKILRSAFANAFAFRPHGSFCPFFSVEYADGLNMLTHGGLFAEKQTCDSFLDKVRDKVPVLASIGTNRYRINRVDLTERERNLFDRAVTDRDANSEELQEIKKLGFRDRELQSYRELLRYYPRYVETLV